MGEDGLFELGKRRTRLEPQIFSELPTQLLIRTQRITLTATAIQAQHQLAPEAFPHRILVDEHLKLCHEQGVAAKSDRGLNALLRRHQAKAVEPLRLRPYRWQFSQIGQRRPPPQPERVASNSNASAARPAASAISPRARSASK